MATEKTAAKKTVAVKKRVKKVSNKSKQQRYFSILDFRAVTPLHLVTRYLQAVESGASGIGALVDNDAAALAKSHAITSVLGALLMHHDAQVFKAEGLKGAMNTDYHFASGEFSAFLNEVRSHLLPDYKFKRVAGFDDKGRKMSGFQLAQEIATQTT